MPKWTEGRELRPGSVSGDKLAAPCKAQVLGSPTGDGIVIETSDSKDARLYFDVTSHQLKVIHDGTTYTIGP